MMVEESVSDDALSTPTTFARSAIVNTEKGKIGYIFLPEFYADFSSPKGIHCSEDVAREVIKLKEQKVDGIVIDLRHNPGGSLRVTLGTNGVSLAGPTRKVADVEVDLEALRASMR